MPELPVVSPAGQHSGRALVEAAIARARARGEVLPRIPRRPLRARHPFRLEAEYFGFLRAAVRALFSQIDRWIEGNYSRMAESVQTRLGEQGRMDASLDRPALPESVARADALNDDLTRFERRARGHWARLEVALTRRARDVAQRVSRENLRVHDEQTKRVLGVSVEAPETWLADEEAIFARENAALIKDIGQTAIDRVARLVTDCARKGSSTRDLQDAVKGELGIAERRAALIAVDQIGKFNGRLTQRRQQAIGVERYTWRGVLDERERPQHLAREGQVFRWDEPPSDGNPGEPIRCRCVAEPVMDDFADLLADEP